MSANQTCIASELHNLFNIHITAFNLKFTVLQMLLLNHSNQSTSSVRRG